MKKVNIEKSLSLVDSEYKWSTKERIYQITLKYNESILKKSFFTKKVHINKYYMWVKLTSEITLLEIRRKPMALLKELLIENKLLMAIPAESGQWWNICW